MAVIPPPMGVRMAWESACSRRNLDRGTSFLARKARGKGDPEPERGGGYTGEDGGEREKPLDHGRRGQG